MTAPTDITITTLLDHHSKSFKKRFATFFFTRPRDELLEDADPVPVVAVVVPFLTLIPLGAFPVLVRKRRRALSRGRGCLEDCMDSPQSSSSRSSGESELPMLEAPIVSSSSLCSRLAGEGLSSTLVSFPSSCEKLDRKLARLSMTLITRVVEGGGGGDWLAI